MPHPRHRRLPRWLRHSPTLSVQQQRRHQLHRPPQQQQPQAGRTAAHRGGAVAGVRAQVRGVACTSLVLSSRCPTSPLAPLLRSASLSQTPPRLRCTSFAAFCMPPPPRWPNSLKRRSGGRRRRRLRVATASGSRCSRRGCNSLCSCRRSSIVCSIARSRRPVRRTGLGSLKAPLPLRRRPPSSRRCLTACSRMPRCLLTCLERWQRTLHLSCRRCRRQRL